VPDKRITAQHGFDMAFVESHSDWLRHVVSIIFHALREAEVCNMAGAALREPSNKRITYRNSYRQRQWTMRVGDIDVYIPKLRHGHICHHFSSLKGAPEGAHRRYP